MVGKFLVGVLLIHSTLITCFSILFSLICFNENGRRSGLASCSLFTIESTINLIFFHDFFSEISLLLIRRSSWTIDEGENKI